MSLLNKGNRVFYSNEIPGVDVEDEYIPKAGDKIFLNQNTITGLLAFDGIDDRVGINLNVTGSQTITFKCYLDSSRDLLVFCFKNSDSDFIYFNYSEGFFFDIYVSNTKFYRYTSSSSLYDEILNISITKTAGVITDLTINETSVTLTEFTGIFNISSTNYLGFANVNTFDKYSKGLIWDLNLSSNNAYEGRPNGNLNSAWEDTIGAIDGSVEGSPTTIDL